MAGVPACRRLRRHLHGQAETPASTSPTLRTAPGAKHVPALPAGFPTSTQAARRAGSTRLAVRSARPGRPTPSFRLRHSRLREIGTEVGVPSYLIADGSELNEEWLRNAKAVGITAGASAPEVLVDDVIEALRRIGPVTVSVLPGREENIEFRLPAELTAG